MVKKKEVVSWTIDSELVKKINKEAELTDRSRSYIANKFLQEAIQ